MIKEKLYLLFGIILKNLFIFLGPIYIKIGQLLSYEYPILNQLYTLQNDCPKLTDNDIHSIQSKYPELNISENSIASGSIAVVHLGEIKLNNQIKTICIKIKRPNIEKKIKSSIWYTKILTYILINLPFLNFLDLKEKINLTLELYEKQTNFIQELENWKLYKKNIKNISNLIIPDFYEEYCNNELLVMEYIPGINIIDIQSSKQFCEKERLNIGRILIGQFISGINKGIIHGDLHCGNIALKDDNLIIYDFGILLKLDKFEKESIIELLDNLIDNDINNAVNVFINSFISNIKSLSNRDIEILNTFFENEGFDLISLFNKIRKNIILNKNLKFNNKMLNFEISILPLTNTLFYINTNYNFKYLIKNLEEDVSNSILEL